MKNIFILTIFSVLLGCAQPTPAPDQPKNYYDPPVIDGTLEVHVLRTPHGMVARGLIAEADPLIGTCTQPGTVYMFYDNNALVQYVPLPGTYTLYSMAVKLSVEAHNSDNPQSAWWDFVSVSMPGPVFDYSHDPVCPPLTIMFLDNAGQLVLNAGNQTFNMTAADATEYATWANADGSPKQLIKTNFESWGANDGVHVIHMQLGGDGASIPAATFHF